MTNFYRYYIHTPTYILMEDVYSKKSDIHCKESRERIEVKEG